MSIGRKHQKSIFKQKTRYLIKDSGHKSNRKIEITCLIKTVAKLLVFSELAKLISNFSIFIFMKKLEWYNLKACKEIRVQTLIASGFNLKTDYFCLDSRKLSILCECMKADGYRYESPLGRSRSRSYWYSLQRVFNRMSK